MRRRLRDHSEYEVGYGKPPAEHRFQPGRSGNPRGRPKGNRPIGDILEGILNQKVTLSEKGRPRKVAVIEVVMLRVAGDAMRGDLAAIKLLVWFADRYRTADGTPPAPGNLQAEDEAILKRYVGSLLASEVKHAIAADDAPQTDTPDPEKTGERDPADEC